MKTILKVLYAVFAIIAAVIIFFGMESSLVSQNYINILKQAGETASKEKDYDDLARCFSLFSTPIDKQKAYHIAQGDENITVIYPSVNNFTSTYVVDGKTKTYSRIENVYLVIIYNPTFQFEDSSDGTNKSAIRIKGTKEDGTDTYYDYNFTVSSKINSNLFIQDATNEKDGSLHAERKHITEYREYNLIFASFPETLMKYMMEDADMKTVTGLNIVENTGKEIYKDSDYITKGSLDYSQEFFTDLSTWVKNANIYMEYGNGKDFEQEVIDEATNYVTDFTTNPDQFVANFSDKYIRGIEREEVFTGAPVYGKALGIVALFLVVIILLYMVLFHLNWIKEFVKRFSKKAEPERKVPNRAPKTQPVISASGVNAKAKVVDAEVVEAKPTEVEEVKSEVSEPTKEEPKTEEENTEN